MSPSVEYNGDFGLHVQLHVASEHGNCNCGNDQRRQRNDSKRYRALERHSEHSVRRNKIRLDGGSKEHHPRQLLLGLRAHRVTRRKNGGDSGG